MIEPVLHGGSTPPTSTSKKKGVLHMSKTESFNKKHPELRDGEIFYSNASEALWELMDDIETKRKGVIAFDARGKRLPKMFPVFIQRSEAEKKKLPALLKFG
jgi:hypothetical protein